MTGGRLLRLKPIFTKNEDFFMTYGDGLCDVDLNHLKSFHFNHKKLATVTAVHPPIKFGELEIENEKVKKFEEKPQTKAGWINGGFFILNYKVFDYIKDDRTLFERQPMEKLAKEENLMAFKHEGFWKCMDSLRDKIDLDKMCNENKAFWKK
jgi:glucose-1-phosphate cytidylyltransferase